MGYLRGTVTPCWASLGFVVLLTSHILTLHQLISYLEDSDTTTFIHTYTYPYAETTEPANMVFETSRQTSRIAIIGAGDVGAAIAFACIMNHAAGEILLLDVKPTFLDAQVLDLNDAAYRGTPSVRSGTYDEAGQCDIIVVTAGAKQRPGESRLELIGRNIEILGDVIGRMRPFKKDAILLLVANPVDVLTCFAQEVAGLPREQVIGSGTFLDSIRLRKRISEKSGVSVPCGICVREDETDGVDLGQLDRGVCPRRTRRQPIREPPSPLPLI